MSKINKYMTSKFAGAFTHPLQRYFVPAVAIADSDKCTNGEVLLNNRILRNFVASDYKDCVIEQGGYIIVDFGRELVGAVRLVTSWMEPCQVRLRFGESISECCGNPNMDHAIHDIVLPVQLLSSVDFGSTGFRYVRLDVLGEKLALVNVLAIAEVADVEQQGYFRSSDERLNEIFDTAVHTVYLNIQDFIFDGIKRDRLLWGGDLHPELLAILNTFGPVEQLETTLSELCNHTLKEKFINEFPSYNLWVLMCIHDLWLYSGDKQLLEKFAPFIVENVDRFMPMIKADGDIKVSIHPFLDWPSREDIEVTQAGLYGLMKMSMEAVKRMLTALSLDTSKVDNALKAFGLQVPETRGNKSAAALQHLAKVADRSAELADNPFRGVSTFLGSYIIFAKPTDQALELIRRYWGGMLDMGATTFWEDFDLDWCENATRIDEKPVAGRPDIHADFGAFCYKGLRHSLCHGWSAGPATWCLQKILGVTPLEAGFKKIAFNPELCDLEFAEGAIPTPYGLIEVKLRKGEEPQITCPEGVSIA